MMDKIELSNLIKESSIYDIARTKFYKITHDIRESFLFENEDYPTGTKVTIVNTELTSKKIGTIMIRDMIIHDKIPIGYTIDDMIAATKFEHTGKLVSIANSRDMSNDDPV